MAEMCCNLFRYIIVKTDEMQRLCCIKKHRNAIKVIMTEPEKIPCKTQYDEFNNS